MSPPRAALPVEDQELKTACGQLVRAYGGQDAAAERLGRRQQHVSDCCNKRLRDKWLRVDDVATLESETLGHDGHPHVTALLARRGGFELVPTPAIAASGRDLLMSYAEQAKRSGKLAETVLAAHADGIIDVEEAEAIEAAADQVIATALAMRAEARMIQREGR